MASAVPLIGWLHANGGFARLFSVLAFAAALIFCATLLLPASLRITPVSRTMTQDRCG
jgi:hypothetical protein